jgi:4-hydroxythreonine-4-phosphate dehydrogenase
MGEPGGIGPEVAVKTLASVPAGVTPVLVGDPDVFAEAAALVGVTDLPEVVRTQTAAGYEKGRPTAAGGGASAAAIRKAVEMAQAGEVEAIVTAPISKEALRMAGLPWPGHTEMLAELTGTDEYAMMLTGGGLRVMLVTIHAGLREVPGLITRARVLRTLRLAARACRMLGISGPRIAVAGLNPHAGEGGMFGVEEVEQIAPAIKDALDEGIAVTGPWPGDTVFHEALKGAHDMVVAMYHDQGLGPLKLVGFDTGVNTTVGLPFIRTSPDHGTAYGIAWTGNAASTSMAAAVNLALTMRL